jgi:hypothetical protein
MQLNKPLICFAISCTICTGASAQADVISRLVNNTSGERTLSIKSIFGKRDNNSGKIARNSGIRLSWYNPVTFRLSTQMGLSYSNSSLSNIGVPFTNVPFKRDNNRLGASFGLSLKVGPLRTRLHGSAFYNHVDEALSITGFPRTTSSDRAAGYALGVSQVLPLGPKTVSNFSLSYADVPSQGTEVYTLSAKIYHGLNENWLLSGGLTSRWSNQSLTLSGVNEYQTVSAGLGYKINNRYGVAGTLKTGLNGADDDYTAGLALRITFDGENK